MGSHSKVQREKYCNYCKNHDIVVLENGHRQSCPKKSCTCHRCGQTYKKTLNVRQWRERNAANAVNVSIRSSIRRLTITEAFEKGIHEYLVFKNELNMSSDSLTLMVYPYNYPQIILFQKNAETLIDLIDSQPSSSNSSKFQYRKVENGALRVVCLNQETRDRFISLVKGVRLILNGSECPFFVIPENETFKHLIMSCVLNGPITSEQFLTSVASNNRFDTSRWECDDSIPIDGGYKVNFAVDPITFRYMLTNDLMLNVKDQEVKAKLELNPFLAYMFEEC